MNQITDELIAENLALSKELKSTKDELCKVKNTELAYSVQVISLGKPAIIRGVLLAEGIWKGSKFVYEKMKEYASKFIGIPIMLEHGHTREFGKLEGGKVTKVVPDDTLRCLAFEGEVYNEDFISYLKDKRVDAVSPKGNWKVDDAQNPPLVIDGDPWELSLTSSPACEFCSIFSMELSCFKETSIRENETNSKLEGSKGGELSMSETKPEDTKPVPTVTQTPAPAATTTQPTQAPAVTAPSKAEESKPVEKQPDIDLVKMIEEKVKLAIASQPKEQPVDVAAIVATEVAKQLAPKPEAPVPDKYIPLTPESVASLILGENPGKTREVSSK